MKKFKKLIPALCMLLVSAVLMGTSTYAWFSMNTTVKADGMAVSAEADSTFLQIGTSTTITAGNTQVSIGNTAASLKLATPLNVASNIAYNATADAESTTTPTKFTSASDILWGAAYSFNPSQVQESNVPTLLQSVNGYVYSTKLYVNVADNGKNGSDLKLSSVTVTGTNTIKDALRVMVVCGGKYMVYDAGLTANAITGDTALLDTITTTATELTVYIWFDGTDAVSKTDTATNLGELSCALEFTCSIAA